jgi:MFS family permease
VSPVPPAPCAAVSGRARRRVVRLAVASVLAVLGTLASSNVSHGLDAEGHGSMTVSPSTVAAGGPISLVFTYTADGNGVLTGTVGVIVPSGWPPPYQLPNDDRTALPCCATGSGITSVGSPPEFFASHIDVGPRQTMTLTYTIGAPDDSNLALGVKPGTYDFTGVEASSPEAILAPLPGPRMQVTVTPPLTATSTTLNSTSTTTTTTTTVPPTTLTTVHRTTTTTSTTVPPTTSTTVHRTTTTTSTTVPPTTSTTHPVVVATTTRLSAQPPAPREGQPVTLTAQVSGPTGPVSGGTVTFEVDGRPFGTEPVSTAGIATRRSLVLGTGVDVITVSYLGPVRGDDQPSSSTLRLVVGRLPPPSLLRPSSGQLERTLSGWRVAVVAALAIALVAAALLLAVLVDVVVGLLERFFMLGFPSDWFDDTYQENDSRIRRSLNRLVAGLHLLLGPGTKKYGPSPRSRRSAVAVFVLVAGLVVTWSSWGLSDAFAGHFVGACAAVLIVTFGFSVVDVTDDHRRYRQAHAGFFQVLAGAVAVAVACSVLTYYLSLQPPYIYGLICAYVVAPSSSRPRLAAVGEPALPVGESQQRAVGPLATERTGVASQTGKRAELRVHMSKPATPLTAAERERRREEGRLAMFSLLVGLVIAGAAWIIWEYCVPTTFNTQGATWWQVAVWTLLGAVFVSGVQTAAFASIPLPFLPGQSIWRWDGRVALVTATAGCFALVVLLVSYGSQAGQPLEWHRVLSAVAAFACFFLISLIFLLALARRTSGRADPPAESGPADEAPPRA